MTTGRAPTPKVTASGAGGAAAVLLVWVAGLCGVEVPAEVAAAAAVLLGTGAAYRTRDRTRPPPRGRRGHR